MNNTNAQNEIPIFFTVDDAYVPYLATALRSLSENCGKQYNYRVIVLHQGLAEENIKKLKTHEKENLKIDFDYLKNNLESITDNMSNRLRCDYFTLTIYFRLFIPELFPQYDKGIYIDSDVVVNADIAELFNIDIGDNIIGACRDLSIADVPPLVAYTENAVGSGKGEYINSGVLLMNLKKMRELKFDEHFLNLLTAYHFDTIAPDQDYINAVCNGKIHYLDETWDAMPGSRGLPEKPKLVHYNLFSKPWCYDGIEFADDFWHYAENSGFIDEIRKCKAEYSEEQKAADAECMKLLVERGALIQSNDITFKKMIENGVKIRL